MFNFLYLSLSFLRLKSMKSMLLVLKSFGHFDISPRML